MIKLRRKCIYPSNAFAYMNLIEHWGSGIPRIIDKVKAAGLREPEFVGGEVDLRINIYRGQVETKDHNDFINANKVPDTTGKCRIAPIKCRILLKKYRIVRKNCRIMSKSRFNEYG